jgi:hypothetical protein
MPITIDLPRVARLLSQQQGISLDEAQRVVMLASDRHREAAEAANPGRQELTLPALAKLLAAQSGLPLDEAQKRVMAAARSMPARVETDPLPGESPRERLERVARNIQTKLDSGELVEDGGRIRPARADERYPSIAKALEKKLPPAPTTVRQSTTIAAPGSPGDGSR